MARTTRLAPEMSFQLSWLGPDRDGAGDTRAGVELPRKARQLGADQGFNPREMYAETGLGLGARRSGHFDVAEKPTRRAGLASAQRFQAAPRSRWPNWASSPSNGEMPRRLLRLQLEGYGLAADGGDPRPRARPGRFGWCPCRRRSTRPRSAHLLGAAARLQDSVGARRLVGATDIDLQSRAESRPVGERENSMPSCAEAPTRRSRL